VTQDVQRWLAQLTRATGTLTGSLDYDMTLQQVVRLPIPTLADWSMVYVPDDGGALPARLMLAHARPTKEDLLRKVWGREWSVLPEQHPIAECLRKRSPIVLSDCDEQVLDRLSNLPEHKPLLRKVGLRSLLVVPLVAHGTVVGGLLLAASQSRRRPYDAAWLDLLGELARAYAQAIYNARLFVETRLALRLRDELILSTRNELLDMVAGLRERRRDRGRVLAWPGTQPTEAPQAETPPTGLDHISHRTTRTSELQALAADLEEIAYRLSTGVDPYSARF
jgi:GAF domain-containing protein